MDLSLTKLRKYSLEDLTEDRLIIAIQMISSNFTKSRENISKYVESASFVTAYYQYYFPTNFPKLKFLFKQLDSNLLDQIKSSPIYDIGSGPGTYSHALIDYFDDQSLDLTLIDTSRPMLDQAKKSLDGYFPNHQSSFKVELNDVKDKATFLFGNSINEMGKNGLVQYVSKYNPETIIFIEPGTKDFFDIALEVREFLIKKGYNCIYPCLRNVQCPMIEKNKDLEVKDWCHQVVRMIHNPSIERIGQKTKLDRKTLPMIAHVYSKNISEVNNNAQMVRFLRETKFSFVWEVCLEIDGSLEMLQAEIMKKKLSKSEIKILKSTSVGHQFSFTVDKIVSEKLWRISLSSDFFNEQSR